MQVIHALIKSNMRGQIEYVGIDIIVEPIFWDMLIISNDDYFGDMVIQLGFFISRRLHKDTTYKGPKGG